LLPYSLTWRYRHSEENLISIIVPYCVTGNNFRRDF